MTGSSFRLPRTSRWILVFPESNPQRDHIDRQFNAEELDRGVKRERAETGCGMADAYTSSTPTFSSSSLREREYLSDSMTPTRGLDRRWSLAARCRGRFPNTEAHTYGECLIQRHASFGCSNAHVSHSNNFPIPKRVSGPARLPYHEARSWKSLAHRGT